MIPLIRGIAFIWLCNAFLTTPVQASSTYLFSGTFGIDVDNQANPNPGNLTGLAGGSFAGSFEANGFPLADGQSETLATFDLEMKNSADQVLYTLTNGNATATVSNSSFNGGRLVISSTLIGNLGLRLLFAYPFDGVGSVIPFSEDEPRSYGGTSSNHYVTVVSGSSAKFTAIPEPTSLVMLGLGAIGIVTVKVRRRHNT